MPTFKKLTAQQMDEHLFEAEESLIDSIPTEAIKAVSTWWNEWYMLAGHRRLGRLLRNQLKNKPTDTSSHSRPMTDKKPARELRAYTTDLGYSYVIRAAELIDAGSMFSVETVGAEIHICLNVSHPIYPLLESSIGIENNNDRFDKGDTQRNHAVRFLLEAWAQFEENQPEGRLRETTQELRRGWGRTVWSMFDSVDDK